MKVYEAMARWYWAQEGHRHPGAPCSGH
jgi:hypothetical protein